MNAICRWAEEGATGLKSHTITLDERRYTSQRAFEALPLQGGHTPSPTPKLRHCASKGVAKAGRTFPVPSQRLLCLRNDSITCVCLRLET